MVNLSLYFYLYLLFPKGIYINKTAVGNLQIQVISIPNLSANSKFKNKKLLAYRII